jgi:hypothetical protein
MGEKWPSEFNLQLRLPRRKPATWNRRLYFPSEGRHAEDFFARKIRRLRPGLNPPTWVPEARANHYTTEAAMCICNFRYPARNARAPYCHLGPVCLYHIFPHYLINGTIFRKNLLNIKYSICFDFLYNSGLKYFSF